MSEGLPVRGSCFSRCYQVKMWSYWIGVGLNSIPGIVTRGKFGHKGTKEEHHARVEAEMGVVWSQAKDSWQPPGAGREA